MRLQEIALAAQVALTGATGAISPVASVHSSCPLPLLSLGQDRDCRGVVFVSEKTTLMGMAGEHVCCACLKHK